MPWTTDQSKLIPHAIIQRKVRKNQPHQLPFRLILSAFLIILIIVTFNLLTPAKIRWFQQNDEEQPYEITILYSDYQPDNPEEVLPEHIRAYQQRMKILHRL